MNPIPELAQQLHRMRSGKVELRPDGQHVIVTIKSQNPKSKETTVPPFEKLSQKLIRMGFGHRYYRIGHTDVQGEHVISIHSDESRPPTPPFNKLSYNGWTPENHSRKTRELYRELDVLLQKKQQIPKGRHPGKVQ